MINLEKAVKYIKNVLFIAGILWAIFTEWSRYQETSKITRDMNADYTTFKENWKKDSTSRAIEFKQSRDSVRSLKKDLSEYEARFDYLEKRTKYDSIDLNIVYSAARHSMDEVTLSGIIFKKAKDGTLYFMKGNLLYYASYDQNSRRYYYIGDDGKTYWCN